MKDYRIYLSFAVAGVSIIIASIAVAALYGSSTRIDVLEDDIASLKDQLASSLGGRGSITQQSIAKMTGPNLDSMNNEDNFAGSDEAIGERIDNIEKEIDDLNSKVKNLTKTGN